jgi:hypothetical protein
MEKISRSVRQAKQAKSLMLTVPVQSYSPYGLTWQDRTDRTMMMWHVLIGGLLVSRVLTRVLGWPMVGGHVAQSVGATCPSLVG